MSHNPKIGGRWAILAIALIGILAIIGSFPIFPDGEHKEVETLDTLSIDTKYEMGSITTYSGTLPCATCDGIETTLTIFPKRETYLLKKVYLGTADSTLVTEGQFLKEEAGPLYRFVPDPGPLSDTLHARATPAGFQLTDAAGYPLGKDNDYLLERTDNS